MTGPSDFDAYVQRLQNITPFMMLHPTPDGEDVVEWFPVDQRIVNELIINHLEVPAQVDLCPAQIQTWGRYRAIAQRACDIVNRRYRVWRDRYGLELLEAAEREGVKKPTKDEIERRARVHKDYGFHYRRIEKADEALSTINVILDAFKTKANLLGAHAPMFREMVR